MNEFTENTEFTLPEHYRERIKFHMQMLNYYLKQEKYEKIQRMGA